MALERVKGIEPPVSKRSVRAAPQGKPFERGEAESDLAELSFLTASQSPAVAKVSAAAVELNRKSAVCCRHQHRD
jgi:hypothetical protein